MVKIINIFLLVVFVAAVLDFTIQNHVRISIKFLEFQSIKLPISVIVFVSVIVGILIGLIYHFYSVYRIKKDLKTQNEKMRNENEKL